VGVNETTTPPPEGRVLRCSMPWQSSDKGAPRTPTGDLVARLDIIDDVLRYHTTDLLSTPREQSLNEDNNKKGAPGSASFHSRRNAVSPTVTPFSQVSR
jgi:hypothetical protein